MICILHGLWETVTSRQRGTDFLHTQLFRLIGRHPVAQGNLFLLITKCSLPFSRRDCASKNRATVPPGNWSEQHILNLPPPQNYYIRNSGDGANTVICISTSHPVILTHAAEVWEPLDSSILPFQERKKEERHNSMEGRTKFINDGLYYNHSRV